MFSLVKDVKKTTGFSDSLNVVAMTTEILLVIVVISDQVFFLL